MRERFGLLVVVGLLAGGCGSSGPMALTAPPSSELTLTIAVHPAPMPSGGLRSSSVVSLGLSDRSGMGGVIEAARLVVRDAQGGVLLQTDVKGPIPIPRGGLGQVTAGLSWTPASELGRTLEIRITATDAGGTRIVERSVSF